MAHGRRPDWKFSENLHRSELDRIERARHEAEWIRLREGGDAQGFSGQVGQKMERGRPESGIALAARELPIKGDTDEAKRHRLRRDMQIASAGDEALDAARDTGTRGHGRVPRRRERRNNTLRYRASRGA